MEEEGIILPREPRYTELAHATRQLELFAANPPAPNSRYDESPPPYASRTNTPSYDSDDGRHEETEEQLQSLRMAGDVHERRLKEDPYYGMTSEQRRRAIEEGKWLTEEARRRKEAEKRCKNEWWASRTYSLQSIFAPDNPDLLQHSTYKSSSPTSADHSTRVSSHSPRSFLKGKEPSPHPISGRNGTIKKSQECSKHQSKRLSVQTPSRLESGGFRRSKRLSTQTPSRLESGGLRRSKRLAERARQEAVQLQGHSRTPRHMVIKPPPAKRRQRGLRR